VTHFASLAITNLAVCGRITTKTFSGAAARAVGWTQRCLARDDLNSLPIAPRRRQKLIAVHGALHPQTDCATVRLDNDERRLQSFQALMATLPGPHLPSATRSTWSMNPKGRAVALLDTKISLRDDAYYLINPGAVGQLRERDRRASL